MKRLYDIIHDKNPRQLKFEFALWTRSMVKDLIKRQFGIKLSVVSVGRLLHQMSVAFDRISIREPPGH